MREVFEILISHTKSSAISSLVIALGLLVPICILLGFGRRLDSAMKLERVGIPIALIFGLIALCIGPYGPIPILPEKVTNIWVNLPTPLLTLVFATLMLSRPIPNAKGLWQPVASQALLAFFLGFGQYLVGGIVVLAILGPYFKVDPLMGCLIEVGFEGGHGAAAIMGESFNKLGFESGLDLGLAMATLGLLSSTLIGSFLVIIGRIKGWISTGINEKVEVENEENPFTFIQQIKQLFVNLGLAGISVLIGFSMLSLLRYVSPLFGELIEEVINVFPVFPLALLGSFILRFVLERTNNDGIISPIFQREIGIISTDLLITIAMAGLNIPILTRDWMPIAILGIAGLVWNLAGMFIFARIFFKKQWFERSLTEFGNATGVAASGLLLLRLADPRDKTDTLPIFSIKQLFLQPILSGGLITVVAPIIINKVGLIEWTWICGLIICSLIIFIFLFTERVSKMA